MIKNNCAECLLRLKSLLREIKIIEKTANGTEVKSSSVISQLLQLQKQSDDEKTKVENEYSRIANHIEKKKVLNDKSIKDYQREIANCDKNGKAIELLKGELDKFNKKEIKIKNEGIEFENFKLSMNSQIDYYVGEVTKSIVILTGKPSSKGGQENGANIKKDRHYLPYLDFDKKVGVGTSFDFLLNSFNVFTLTHETTKLLTNAFTQKNINEIIKFTAEALNCEVSKSLLIYQFKDRIYLKYGYNPELNEELKPLGVKFDFNSTKSWYFKATDANSIDVSVKLGHYFDFVVDVNDGQVFKNKLL